ncbi:hypothetical protein AAVH_23516 [Aphelenchoides avenae]|nr:hypothetical protein AAVH_23516 [Aphelenchus avenae]
MLQVGRNNVRIRLRETDKAVRGKQAREELFDRVNNAFVDRLVLSFRRENLSVLHGLRARVDDLQCQIRALRVTDAVEEDGNKVALDYALIDFLGVHLKPQLYEATTSEEGHAMLFT